MWGSKLEEAAVLSGSCFLGAKKCLGASADLSFPTLRYGSLYRRQSLFFHSCLLRGQLGVGSLEYIFRVDVKFLEDTIWSAPRMSGHLTLPHLTCLHGANSC